MSKLCNFLKLSVFLSVKWGNKTSLTLHYIIVPSKMLQLHYWLLFYSKISALEQKAKNHRVIRTSVGLALGEQGDSERGSRVKSMRNCQKVKSPYFS